MIINFNKNPNFSKFTREINIFLPDIVLRLVVNFKKIADPCSTTVSIIQIYYTFNYTFKTRLSSSTNLALKR